MNIGQLKKEIENLNDDVRVRICFTKQAEKVDWNDVYECVEERTYNPDDDSRGTYFNLMVGIDELESEES